MDFLTLFVAASYFGAFVVCVIGAKWAGVYEVGEGEEIALAAPQSPPYNLPR